MRNENQLLGQLTQRTLITESQDFSTWVDRNYQALDALQKAAEDQAMEVAYNSGKFSRQDEDETGPVSSFDRDSVKQNLYSDQGWDDFSHIILNLLETPKFSHLLPHKDLVLRSLYDTGKRF